METADLDTVSNLSRALVSGFPTIPTPDHTPYSIHHLPGLWGCCFCSRKELDMVDGWAREEGVERRGKRWQQKPNKNANLDWGESSAIQHQKCKLPTAATAAFVVNMSHLIPEMRSGLSSHWMYLQFYSNKIYIQ
ncbi:hypothetical protein EON65_35950 [archaeon]|nr:MAG: hypothetical protein EON65_35950 [archaeon]